MNGEAAVGGGGGGAGGDFTSIPTELRKTIQNIREITGKQHSDDDIYNMLTECSLDPDETAQKLLYLGKYHRANLFASMHLPAFPPLCIVSVRQGFAYVYIYMFLQKKKNEKRKTEDSGIIDRLEFNRTTCVVWGREDRGLYRVCDRCAFSEFCFPMLKVVFGG